jgi:hypothetical protein
MWLARVESMEVHWMSIQPQNSRVLRQALTNSFVRCLFIQWAGLMIIVWAKGSEVARWEHVI